MPKLLISIVTYNSEVYITECLKSLFSEEARKAFSDFSVTVIDNASMDGTLSRIEGLGFPVEVIRNARNNGFAGGHNQAFRLAREREIPLVLIVNPDVVFTPTCVAEMVRVMESDDRVASVGPKLLRSEHAILDSTGIVIFKNRKAVDRGSGEKDAGQYDVQEEVLGISGALALYRVSALEDAKLGNEYFDEDFFAYKEDVDMSWRLSLLGWRSLYVPQAIAFHHRNVGEGKRRASRSPLASRFSYRNHLCMLVKNEQWGNGVRHLPFILFFELQKFAYLCMFERTTLAGLVDFFRLFPTMVTKRKELHRKVRVTAKEMRRWLA